MQRDEKEGGREGGAREREIEREPVNSHFLCGRFFPEKREGKKEIIYIYITYTFNI
jgi:hypothetical protein